MSRLRKNGALAAAAITLVGSFEGLRNYAYRDPVNIPTICFGETRGVKMGDYKTTAECKAMLGARLIEFETGITRCLKNPDSIPDNAWKAALSLSYNIGIGAFCGSTVRKRFDAGDLKGACDAFLMWNKVTVAGFRVSLPGLTKRRKEERSICRSGL